MRSALAQRSEPKPRAAAERTVLDPTAGGPNDVNVAILDAEHLENVDPTVHACNQSQGRGKRQRRPAAGERSASRWKEGEGLGQVTTAVLSARPSGLALVRSNRATCAALR